MQRLKKMPHKIRKELEKAANLMATGRAQYYSQHTLLPNAFWGTHECLMIYDLGNGFDNIKDRLMGAAIMLTMPSEIINHECSPK